MTAKPAGGGEKREPMVSREHLHIMQHAMGHLRGSRNYFSTGPGSKDWVRIQELTEMGLMVSRGTHPLAPSDTTFSVTEAGARFAFDFEMLSGAQMKLVKRLAPISKVTP